MQTEINALDLAFVVDTTGSMGHLIGEAQKQMVAMMRDLSQAQDVNLRFGVVEYRDHPPQEKTFVFKAHDFTNDLKRAQKTIDGLKADGGGDGPEAVFDGIVGACEKLGWRSHARRIAVLVGDAAPHGVGERGDGFREGCPCGQTTESVTAIAENTRVTVYALGLYAPLERYFKPLAVATGGEYFTGFSTQAMQRLHKILETEFGQMDFDRQVLELRAAQDELNFDFIAAQLGTSRPAVAASLSRLGGRGLL